MDTLVDNLITSEYGLSHRFYDLSSLLNIKYYIEDENSILSNLGILYATL